MLSTENRVPTALPLYAKIALSLLIVALLLMGVYLGHEVLVPMCFALLFALLLQPLSSLLERHRVPRSLAIFACLLTMLALVGLLMYFVSTQLINLTHEMGQMQGRFAAIITRVQEMVTARFGIEKANQLAWLKSSGSNLLHSSGSFLSGTLFATTHIFVDLGLMLIFVFFFLFYRNFFQAFLYRLFTPTSTEQINVVLYKIRDVVKSYLLGLVTVIGIVATMNVVGLMLLGIDYALFFGVLAAVLAVIPYIGIAIGALLPILLALVTKDSAWYALGVAGVFAASQLISDNVITPYVVGSKVSVNPLAAMIALLLGGVMWGAAGMILAIPFTAIIKVILDSVESLQPFGFLLGEPPIAEVKPREDAVDVLRKNLTARVKGRQSTTHI